jgi:hypothetical protein
MPAADPRRCLEQELTDSGDVAPIKLGDRSKPTLGPAWLMIELAAIEASYFFARSAIPATSSADDQASSSPPRGQP